MLHVRQKNLEIGSLPAVLTEPVWHTALMHFWTWFGESRSCIFSLNLAVGFSLLPVSLHVLPCGSQRAPTSPFSRLWGRVAGSRSVSEFRRRGEVTSGFLCGDGQVLWCYCEGRKTSSIHALLVNVWNLILWTRAPVGGNTPLSQSSHPASLFICLVLLSLYTLCFSAVCDTLCKEKINFVWAAKEWKS